MADITFNEKKYYELKLLYEKAVQDYKDHLVFEGQLIHTSYVKYLLEHLRKELNIVEKS